MQPDKDINYKNIFFGTFVCTKYYLIIFNANNNVHSHGQLVHCAHHSLHVLFLVLQSPTKRLLIYNPNLNFKMKSHKIMR